MEEITAEKAAASMCALASDRFFSRHGDHSRVHAAGAFGNDENIHSADHDKTQKILGVMENLFNQEHEQTEKYSIGWYLPELKINIGNVSFSRTHRGEYCYVPFGPLSVELRNNEGALAALSGYIVYRQSGNDEFWFVVTGFYRSEKKVSEGRYEKSEKICEILDKQDSIECSKAYAEAMINYATTTLDASGVGTLAVVSSEHHQLNEGAREEFAKALHDRLPEDMGFEYDEGNGLWYIDTHTYSELIKRIRKNE